MGKILIPSSGPDDWKRFLAKPDLHWAKGYSARTLAYAWESASNFRPEVLDLISAAFGPAELLFAIPEHKTALQGEPAKVNRTCFCWQDITRDSRLTPLRAKSMNHSVRLSANGSSMLQKVK